MNILYKVNENRGSAIANAAAAPASKVCRKFIMAWEGSAVIKEKKDLINFTTSHDAMPCFRVRAG
jgi:hypothetical protein